MEGELLYPGRKFGRRAYVSMEIGWKEIFFQKGRFEGELLFPGVKFGRRASVSRNGKVGRRASISRKEARKERICLKGGAIRRKQVKKESL